jgi:hypothetical protein
MVCGFYMSFYNSSIFLSSCIPARKEGLRFTPPPFSLMIPVFYPTQGNRRQTTVKNYTGEGKILGRNFSVHNFGVLVI